MNIVAAVKAATPARWRGPLLLALLVAAAVYLRTRGLGQALWIDEGLSVGIASHPLLDIPGVLRQDGSPPLYYMLLHVWIDLIGGSGEVRVQAFSAAFGILAVPAALVAGRTLFGPRAGWVAAALAALNPFLSIYSQEARMYSLLCLLGLLAATALARVFALRDRRFAIPSAVLLVLMLYTHNWSLFFTAAALVAAVLAWRRADAADRHGLLRDSALVFGMVALLYLPWLPTLLDQAAHTGAPWANRPGTGQLVKGLAAMLGGHGPAMALLLAAGSGVAALGRERSTGPARTAWTLVVLAAGTLLIAWVASNISPAWASRYLIVALGPLLLLLAGGLAAASRLGAVALGLTLAFWAFTSPPGSSKSEERAVLRELNQHLRPGDLVVATHPERVPVLHYYLPDGLRYATPLGPVKDPGVMNWRDALPELESARAAARLGPLLDAVPPGRRVLLVRPLTNDSASWKAPWTHRVRELSREWALAISRDRRYRSVAVSPRFFSRLTAGVRGVVYERRR